MIVVILISKCPILVIVNFSYYLCILKYKDMEKFKRNSDFVDYGEYSKFSYSGIYGIVNTINN